MSQVIGDSATPVYRFEWDDGSSRTTDEIDIDPDAVEKALADEVENDEVECKEYLIIEALAECARDDESCDVTVIGFQ